MLGQSVADPHAIEGSIPRLPGLGMLSIDTVMTENKTTRQVEFLFDNMPCKGYEIHQGITTICEEGGNGAADEIESDKTVMTEGNCIGTYIHGFLDNAAVIEHILKPYTGKKESAPAESPEEFKNRQYDLLADHVRKYVDIKELINIMKK